MREIAQHTVPRPVLRVMIFAADPVRRAGLMVIVSNAGHAISDDPDQADVVLADGVLPATDLPAVTLGGNVPTHAGLLPPDASPEQIDAAIRAVATGLVVRTVEASRPAFAAADAAVTCQPWGTGPPVRTAATTSAIARTETWEPAVVRSTPTCVVSAMRWLLLRDRPASSSWAADQPGDSSFDAVVVTTTSGFTPNEVKACACAWLSR